MQAEITERVLEIRERITGAAARAGRLPEEITLVGVSKHHSAESVRAAWAAGVQAFGENYVQEAREKCAQLGELLINCFRKFKRIERGLLDTQGGHFHAVECP